MNLWDGTQELEVTPSVWDGGTEVEARAAIMPFGYSSADHMVASAPFFIAHRGGSRNWPEMTPRGMTESAARGVGALEISLGRTSDGVWFGLHDDTLDRTAGVTGLPTARTMTWAEVQTYKNGTDRYYLLEELVKPWAKSHVLFIDPKYDNFRTAELFPILNGLIAPQRVVMKSYGNNQRFANDSRAAGYKSWGYYYPADFDSGMYEANKHVWDYLGIPYDAATPYWDLIKLENKPIIAHIAPTRAAVDMGLSKGAKGIMTSGITAAFGGGI